MSDEDRQKWDARYSDPEFPSREPSVLLTQFDDVLPRSGRALDVAGGGGRHALWLARRGLETTLVDVSAKGLEIAARRAAEEETPLTTTCVDLREEPFPPGPWNVIVSFHYLQRNLFEMAFASELAPGGWLVFVQPTRSNLQRHEKPPEGFLLEDGELPTLAGGLEIVRYEEGWLAEGRHDALLVARRATP